MPARYAVYLAPAAQTTLAALGRQWLGRDAESGMLLSPPDCVNGAVEWWRSITEAPRRYGFHGTMKPPFALAAGRSRDELGDAMRRLAQDVPAFSLPPLMLTEIGSFLALVPSASCAALTTLADRCVVELDDFRDPASEAELARRRAAALSPRQDELLRRWGYPYVFEEFRFHMTLTDGIADVAERRRAAAVLLEMFAPVCREPVPVDDLCLFVQPAADAPFSILERMPLGRRAA